MESKRPDHEETKVIHGGPEPDPLYGALTVPIYQSSTFSFPSAEGGAARFDGRQPGYIYTRLANPTTRALEQRVAELEGGHNALATSSGMAAVSTVLLGLLGSGDHLVGTDAVYGATRSLAEKHLARYGIAASWVPTERIDALRSAMRPNTRIVYIETPANPTNKISDLEACGRIAKEHGALFVVDNTFASPILQKPFRFGADAVVHSMTKYLNGHSDVVAGIIISGSEGLHAELAGTLQHLGGTIDPHQAWLVLRGLRTLSMRIERIQENAARLAAWLEAHPKVAWVSYPGLSSHPQHELMKKQMEGPGGMIAFGLRGGFEAAKRMIDSVRLVIRAVSLGGLETLIEHPASMSHAIVPRAQREATGVTDDLIRLSVGCEAYEDLDADLAQALDRVPDSVS